MRALVTLILVLAITVSASGASDTTALPTKNPTTAVLYSLALPGLGQYYTESYWKIPIITGTAVVSAWQFFRNNADFNNTSDLYDQAVAAGAPTNIQETLLRQREAFRDNRDLAGVVFLVTYGLAAVDAYVGAHLYDFDVGDNLSLGLGPNRQSILAFNARIRF